jgi:hypothetical protein
MQLTSLRRRLTPAQLRRRRAKIARRCAVGHVCVIPETASPLHGVHRTRRTHLTFADLRRRLFGRSRAKRRMPLGRLPRLAEIDAVAFAALASSKAQARRE